MLALASLRAFGIFFSERRRLAIAGAAVSADPVLCCSPLMQLGFYQTFQMIESVCI